VSPAAGSRSTVAMRSRLMEPRTGMANKQKPPGNRTSGRLEHFQVRLEEHFSTPAAVLGIPAEDGQLSDRALMIAGQRARLADRAVTGHHEGHRVGADRGADRA